MFGSCPKFFWKFGLYVYENLMHVFSQLNAESRVNPSSETQGQLVGTTRFSWAKVYNKSGRAPGHLLLPNEFQKRLKSRLLIGQKIFFWPISEEEQPGDSHVFLHEVDFSSSIAVVAWPVQREHF